MKMINKVLMGVVHALLVVVVAFMLVVGYERYKSPDMGHLVSDETKQYNLHLIESLNDIIEKKYGIRVDININYTDLGKTTVGSSIPSTGDIFLQYQLVEMIPISYDNTIIHEFAHVVDFELNGFVTDGHGDSWKQIMVDLGVKNPKAILSSGVVFDAHYKIHEMKEEVQ